MSTTTGIRDDRITIVSREPYEEQEFAHRERAPWMWYIAAGGGLLGPVGAV